VVGLTAGGIFQTWRERFGFSEPAPRYPCNGAGGALAADVDADNDVDLRDYAILADAWLEEILWP
jgi:hypothetical protein